MQSYTPATNPEIFGFEDLIETFKARCQQQKMPQSILLHGPKGIGKATFAYHLARYLFQGHPESFQVRDTSPLFSQVSQGAFEGLKVLDRHTKGLEKRVRTIPIDAVRQIVQFLHITARNGQWRVVIVDSVDELHYKAANALLKTLEEPPQKTLVILITHSLGRVLPTLKSRCLQFNKSFLSPAAMNRALMHLLPSVTAIEKELYTLYAMGCPGRMMSLMTLGAGPFYQEFLKVMSGVAIDDLRPALSFIDKCQSHDQSDIFYDAFGEFFSWWLGRLVTPLKQPLASFPEESKVMKSLHQKHPITFWLNFWSHATELMTQTEEISLDRRAILTSLFYEMSQGNNKFRKIC